MGDFLVRLFANARITISVLGCLALMAVAPQVSVDSGAFYGMRLGETSSQVRAALGSPALTGLNEHAVFWSYRMDGNTAWRVAIMQGDHVVGIYVRRELGRTSRLPDGDGLSLGDSILKMYAQRGVADPLVNSTYSYSTASGVYRLYEITLGVITAIGITRSYDYPLPILATWDQRDGQTPYRAYLLGKGDQPIQSAEMHILHEQSCDSDGAWRLVKSTRLHMDGRLYDRLLVACNVPVYQRNFFFDVTAASEGPEPSP